MYISDTIRDEYKKWKNGDIVLLTAPTGTGKTTFILEKLLPYVLQYGGRILYLVNRKILKEQLLVELGKIQNKFLLDKGGVSSIERYISIATYQQYEKAILSLRPLQIVDELNNYSLVVYDECHYFYADSSFNTYTELSYDMFRMAFMNKIQIFMSATMENMESIIAERYYFDSSMPYRLPNDPCVKKYVTPSDYEYINLSYFNTKDEMKTIITDSSVSDKWLIFTDSIESGKVLCNELRDTSDNVEDVGFIDAKYAQDEESSEIVEEITKNNISQKRILIATAVIDNGISIKDENLRNIVIMADVKESFIQMLGRKRPDGQYVNLYICKRDRRYFEQRLRYVNQILGFYDKQAAYLNQIFQDYSRNGYVFPFIKNYEADCQNYLHTNPTILRQNTECDDETKKSKLIISQHQPVMFAWYIQQNILMNILSNAKMYDCAKKLLYPINGLYAVNSFSLRRFRQLQVFYADMLKRLSEDENAFVKQQAAWLGISEEKVSMVIQESKEGLVELHKAKIIDLLEDGNYIENEISRDDNIRKLKLDLKEELKFFAGNLDCDNKEEKEKFQNIHTELGKNDRPISEKNFNLLMEIAALPYKMSKKGGSIFWIEKVQN